VAKRCALVFAAVGYLIPVWYHTTFFYPAKGVAATLLYKACLACINVTTSPAGHLRGALILEGPINAILYGLAGYLVAKLIQKFRKRLRGA